MERGAAPALCRLWANVQSRSGFRGLRMPLKGFLRCRLVVRHSLVFDGMAQNVEVVAIEKRVRR